jgi:hypothetical protein
MTPVNHQNGTSGGYSPDTFFDFDAFEQKIHRVFHGTPMIRSCKVTHTKDNLVIYMDFDEVLEKFSFVFHVNFIEDKKPEEPILKLKKIVYEVPKSDAKQKSLEDHVHALFLREVLQRINGAIAESKFIEIMEIIKSSKASLKSSNPLKLISDYLVSGEKKDKSGIDIHMTIITKNGYQILDIDIKSYPRGLDFIKGDIAGLYINNEYKDRRIIKKIRLIVKDFLKGEYLRI